MKQVLMVRGGDDDGEKAAAAATTALAFDREKRVYKDAYVRNFRRVRHFPALAAIGAGHSDGESIILVQEAPPPASTSSDAATTATPRRAPSLLPPDAVGTLRSCYARQQQTGSDRDRQTR